MLNLELLVFIAYINHVILWGGGANDDMMSGGRGGVQIGPKKDDVINLQPLSGGLLKDALRYKIEVRFPS